MKKNFQNGDQIFCDVIILKGSEENFPDVRQKKIIKNLSKKKKKFRSNYLISIEFQFKFILILTCRQEVFRFRVEASDF